MIIIFVVLCFFLIFVMNFRIYFIGVFVGIRLLFIVVDFYFIVCFYEVVGIVIGVVVLVGVFIDFFIFIG